MTHLRLLASTLASIFACSLLLGVVDGTDFTRLPAERINVNDFAENSEEGHIMPPPAFFVQQLKNMCHHFEHEALSYYICSHLTAGQKYVVPILDYHEDEGGDDHVFMLELMPRKVYYHADSPVAMTTHIDELNQDMRVLVPKQHVPLDRLKSLAEELAQTAR